MARVNKELIRKNPLPTEKELLETPCGCGGKRSWVTGPDTIILKYGEVATVPKISRIECNNCGVKLYPDKIGRARRNLTLRLQRNM